MINLNSLNNLSIGKRLALGFGATAAMMVIGTMLALYSTTSINTRMDETLTDVRNMVTFLQVQAKVDDVYLDIWNLISTTEAESKQMHQQALDKARSTYLKHVASLKEETRTAVDVR